MRNLAPSRALLRRSRTLLEAAFVLVAAGIFLAIIGLALYAFPPEPLSTAFDVGRAGAFFGGLAVAFGGLLLALRAVTTRVDNDLALDVGRALEPHFDNRFVFIRNVSKRGLGYIDGLMIGLPGVMVFRIVDLDGDLLNERGNWLRGTASGRWRPTMVNPTREAVEDVQALRRYLAQRDLPDIPVFAVVVFAVPADAITLTLHDPVVPAVTLQDLPRELNRHFLKNNRLDLKTARAVVKQVYDV